MISGSSCRGFLDDGKEIGSLLWELRKTELPLALIYGANCPPEIRMKPAQETGTSERDLARIDAPNGGVALGSLRSPESSRLKVIRQTCPTIPTVHWITSSSRTDSCTLAARPTLCGSPFFWIARTRGS